MRCTYSKLEISFKSWVKNQKKVQKVNYFIEKMAKSTYLFKYLGQEKC